MLSGGGGLVSSTDDYLQFCHMLLNGGELNGARLLSPRTLRFMTTNHLPGGRTLNEMGQSTFAESAMESTGFGLGFSVLLDPAANQSLGTPGQYAWGSATSTAFWVDRRRPHGRVHDPATPLKHLSATPPPPRRRLPSTPRLTPRPRHRAPPDTQAVHAVRRPRPAAVTSPP